MGARLIIPNRCWFYNSQPTNFPLLNCLWFHMLKIWLHPACLLKIVPLFMSSNSSYAQAYWFWQLFSFSSSLPLRSISHVLEWPSWQISNRTHPIQLNSKTISSPPIPDLWDWKRSPPPLQLCNNLPALLFWIWMCRFYHSYLYISHQL